MEDFVHKAIPRTPQEAFSNSAEGRATQITKSALQGYIDEYFSSNGRFRHQIKSNFNFAIQYETRLSLNNSDPSVYEMQLSRLWGELNQNLPSIMILDGAPSYEQSGLGGISNDFVIQESIAGCIIPLTMSFPIEIRAAANDVATTSDLRDMLINIFGPLTSLNRSHILKSGNTKDKWEIRLSQTAEIGSINKQGLDGDTKDAFWYSSITIEVVFEGLLFFSYESVPDVFKDGRPKVGFGQKSSEDDIRNRLMAWHQGIVPDSRMVNGQFCRSQSITDIVVSLITVPESVPLHGTTKINAPQIPFMSYFRSSDPRVAVMKDTVIQPRVPGEFEVQLVIYKSGKPGPTEVLKSWPVRIRS